MSDCCKIEHKGTIPTCPSNGQVTKPVARITVESLIAPAFRGELLPQPYYLCAAPDCDTIYVSALGDHLITKDMLTVRVGFKETEDPLPLCYCFGYDRKAVRDDIRETGGTEIQTIITAKVKAGACECERKNPSGGCCLGQVSKAIKEAKSLKTQGLL